MLGALHPVLFATRDAVALEETPSCADGPCPWGAWAQSLLGRRRLARGEADEPLDHDFAVVLMSEHHIAAVQLLTARFIRQRETEGANIDDNVADPLHRSGSISRAWTWPASSK